MDGTEVAFLLVLGDLQLLWANARTYPGEQTEK